LIYHVNSIKAHKQIDATLHFFRSASVTQKEYKIIIKPH